MHQNVVITGRDHRVLRSDGAKAGIETALSDEAEELTDSSNRVFVHCRRYSYIFQSIFERDDSYKSKVECVP